MNPRSGTKNDDKNDGKATPFDQIAQLEDREDARAREALAAMERELAETERMSKQKTEESEASAMAAAREEIRAFAKKEPAEILAREQKKAEQELANIDESFSKHGSSVAKKLVESILDFSTIS